MFERYTESARRSLFFARYDATQLGSISIEPEHLLLGLLRDSRAISALVPVALEGLRAEIEKRVVFTEKVSTSVEVTLVDELARTPRDGREAGELVKRIHESLDALLKGYGMR